MIVKMGGAMMANYAVVWPEGQHDKARAATGFWHMLWLEWLVGIATYWPNPAHAKRVTTFRFAKDDGFAELDPATVAYAIEEELNGD